jgi:hypothetical protein
VRQDRGQVVAVDDVSGGRPDRGRRVEGDGKADVRQQGKIGAAVADGGARRQWNSGIGGHGGDPRQLVVLVETALDVTV